MTPEELQRAIEFLTDHHAKFAVEMDKINYAQLKFQLQLGSLGEAVIAVTGMVGRLTEAQIKTEAAQSKTDEELSKLAKRMDAFILVLERYISENQNGTSP
ncbi:MAG TPA: hypothetical protein VLU47_14355 [Blastocatellia bacterium]|nr:hypothetical protein [Blastocatellia bacterium]